MKITYDVINGLLLQLLGAVQVGKYKCLTSILIRQVQTQSLLAHNLQITAT